MSNEIAEAEPSRSQCKLALSFIEAFGYTTTALRAIAEAHRKLDDDAGARLIEEFALRFAEHEAAVT